MQELYICYICIIRQSLACAGCATIIRVIVMCARWLQGLLLRVTDGFHFDVLIEQLRCGAVLQTYSVWS